VICPSLPDRPTLALSILFGPLTIHMIPPPRTRLGFMVEEIMGRSMGRGALVRGDVVPRPSPVGPMRMWGLCRQEIISKYDFQSSADFGAFRQLADD